jgi:hypothetical protein
MYIKLVIPLMVLASSPVFASQQTSTTVKLVTLGQLDGPRLRQMAPYMCGPYFTFAPTDRRGGGMVYFGVTSLDSDDDTLQPSSPEVVGFNAGAIRPRLCDTCDAPRADRQIGGASEVVNLAISARDFKLSTCLRRLKLK